MIRWIVAATLALLSAAAHSQAYPSRPVRLIVHVPPGGAPDITARVLGERLSKAFAQPVVVENRAGANGNVAGELVVKSPPDGYTLLMCVDSQIVINPHVYRKMSFDPMKDLVPVVSVGSNEFFLATHPNRPFRTLQEFIDHARRARPPLTYGSAGNGSQHQLTMEMLKARAGIDLLHIPFNGAAPATTAVIAGEVDVIFAGSTTGPQIRAGKLRGLATAAAKRLAAFPDIPTVGEFYPGFHNSIWLGICAPSATPEPVLAKLRKEVNALLATAEVRDAFIRSGALEPFITTTEEFTALIQADYEKYGKVARTLGTKVD